MADDDLRARVRLALPANVRALMDEVEAFAGLQIGFDHYRFPPPAHSALKKQAGTQISHEEATIFLQHFDEIDLHAVTHELLHIRRNWLEGVPQLHPVKGKDTDHNLTSCGTINNELEHLVIVPQESKYGFDSSGHWNAVARAKWRRYPWPDITDPVGRRNNALLGRLSLQLVNDPEVLALGVECLRTEGLAIEADKFASRISQFLGNKPRALGCAVRFLRIPKGLTQLVYFDVRHRRRRVEPVPPH